MTSSRKAGPPTSQPPHGGPPAGGGDAVPGAAAGHRALLTNTLEHDIIPRLIQASHPFEPSGEAPDLAAMTGRPVGLADVHELARLSLLPDDQPARSYVAQLRRRGVPVETLFTDLLGATARHLGEWWEQDLCTFSDVTVGIGRLQQALRDISPGLVARPHAHTPPLRILLVPAPGEQHTFGLVMVSELFRSAGWDVSGGPSPTLDPAVAVRRDWYDVVGFSLAAQVHLPRLAPAIAAVRKASLNQRVGIMVGGPLFMLRPSLASEVGADAVAVNGGLAPEIAAKLAETRAAPC